MKEPDMRALALDVLLEISENGVFSQEALGGALSKYQYLEKRERAFLTRLVEGTLDYRIRLDYVIDQFSRTPIKKQRPVIREILRMSVYQMMFMDSVPDRAVCDEAVKLARKRGLAGLAGFVNGVLRNISRGLEEVSYPSGNDTAEYLSVIYSMPEWIVETWIELYGKDRTKAALKSFLEERPLYIRVNRRRTSVTELAMLMEDAGVTAEAVPGADFALKVSGYDYPEALPGFADGLFWIQDLSSMLAADEACTSEGALCVDVCAAPGGKSFCLAEAAGNQGCVEARDISASKAVKIREGASRLHFDNINVSVREARALDEALVGRADVVLADLPCSGLGVLGRKPDLKYRITPDQIDELQKLQREILETVQSYVKPGGVLIYSTCTVSRRENEENADWFAANFPFEEVISRQLLPGDGGSDGFFISKFIRKAVP